MEVCILSPHRDDAAFSCGLTMRALLSAGVSLTLVNVCSRSSYAPYVDTTAGNGDSLRNVTEIRRREDEKFISMLMSDAGVGSSRVQAVDLGWLDAPDRRNTLPEATLQRSALDLLEVQALAMDLKPVLSAEIVIAPAAIGGHFDHRLVNAAVSSMLPATRIIWYEDLPYAARLAEGQRSQSFPGRPFLLLPASRPHDADRKREYVLCYPSQVDQATAQEISNHTSGLGGREKFYGLMSALEGLRRLAP